MMKNRELFEKETGNNGMQSDIEGFSPQVGIPMGFDKLSLFFDIIEGEEFFDFFSSQGANKC